MRKKWLSLFMALVMLFSCFTPVSVLAEEASYTPGPDAGTNTYHLDSSNFDGFVSSFATYATWTIKLHTDIDLSGKSAYTTALFNANFSGTFDGGGHTISGLQINHTVSKATTDSWTGMFPKLLSGATVTNFTLADSSIISNGCAVGAVAGQISGASISDVMITNTTVQGSGQVGGIVSQTSGANNSITDCSFGGSVRSTNYHSTGGIVGLHNSSSSITISGCVNSGTISANNLGTGGIMGYALGTGTISSCRNTGSVTTTSGDGVGGIVGRTGAALTISACVNEGGIANSASYGAGGIVGHITSASTISACANNGTVTAASYGAGGIVGHITTASTISGCANSGAISADYGVGGIVGNKQNAAKLTVNSCLNTGALSSTNLGYVGGILGRLASADSTNAFIAEISGCLSTGSLSTVKNGNAVGGIVGYTNAPNDWGAKMTNCYTTYSRITGSNNTGTYNTVDANSAVRTAAQLTSANAIVNAPGLDFAGRTWAVVEGGTPVLAALSDGNVLYYDWYVGQSSSYSIANANALKAFALLSQVRNFSGETVQLTADITEVGTFPMIGSNAVPFAGTFNGQGHSISGLTIVAPSTDLIGMFSRVASSSTIRNFKLLGSTISGGNLSGAIIGRSDGCTVESVYTNATFTSAQLCLGGIVGSTWGDGTIVRNCWFDGTMNLTRSGNNFYAGGIVGENRVGALTIDNCLFTGSIITENGSRLGGILGVARSGDVFATVSHCLATGTITSNPNTTYEGPIVGLVEDTERAAVSGCYATTTTGYGYLYSHTTGYGYEVGAAVAPAQLTGANAIINAPALDFAGGTWVAVESGTPVLAALSDAENVYLGWYVGQSSPYSLANKNALQGFAALSKFNDFSGETVQLTQSISDVGEFPMIGTTSLPFAGTFDGQGNTISGLTIEDTSSANSVGLFRKISGATVRNFKLTGSTITTNSLQSGVIVGRSQGGTVENVYTDATFEAGNIQLGGIVGSTWGATTTVRNCWFAGTMNLTKAQPYAGGIVGESREGTLTVENCLLTGSITANTAGNGKRLGGIVGRTAGDETIVRHCLATGVITTNSNKAYEGPIVGLVEDTAKATVSDCYATTATGYSYLYAHSSGYGYVVGTALAPAQLTGANAIINAPALDFAGGTWVAVESGTPVLAALSDAENVYLGWYVGQSSPYSLANKNALQGFAAVSKSHDFSGKTVALGDDIVSVGDFAMIGSDAVPFAGTFDGQNHTVSGVMITVTAGSTSTTTPAGFFARISGATIQDFKLTDSTVTSDASYAGAIVGRATGGTNTVSGVYSDAGVTGYSMSGGLIGFASDDADKIATTVNLSDSWFDGSVAVDHNAVGGLVGQAGNAMLTLQVTDCLFTGTISSADSNVYVGGLVGRVHKTTTVTLADSVSAGTQTQGGLAVGSATGSGSVTLTDVYAAENGELPAIVSGTSTGDATILTASQLTGYSAAVNATGLDFTEKWTAIVDGVAQPTAVRAGTAASAPANYYADISSYRGETYTAPAELTGSKIFAGWYLDENFTVALDEETTDGAAFAKWVDKDILTVRYQFKAADSLDNPSVTMRVLTTVDSKDYQNVTFVFGYNAKTKEFTSKHTYATVSGQNKDGTEVTYYPNSKIDSETYYWSADSQYICGYNITVPSKLYDTELTVSAQWKTADGTIVSGAARSVTLRSDSAFTA